MSNIEKKDEKKTTSTFCILLRKLTMKSRVGFGDHPRLTVAEYLNIFGIKAKKELIEAYYDYSKITFDEKVLKELGIQESEFIKKPGKDTKKGEEVLKRYTVNLNEHKYN